MQDKKRRVSGLMIKNNKILLIKRVKPNQIYYTFPGGTVETGETLLEAIHRELMEELSVNAEIEGPVFKVETIEKKDTYFKVTSYTGEIQLGGPEILRMNADNQYIFEWVPLVTIETVKNLYPHEAVAKLKEFFAL